MYVLWCVEDTRGAVYPDFRSANFWQPGTNCETDLYCYSAVFKLLLKLLQL